MMLLSSICLSTMSNIDHISHITYKNAARKRKNIGTFQFEHFCMACLHGCWCNKGVTFTLKICLACCIAIFHSFAFFPTNNAFPFLKRQGGVWGSKKILNPTKKKTLLQFGELVSLTLPSKLGI